MSVATPANPARKHDKRTTKPQIIFHLSDTGTAKKSGANKT